MNRFLHNRWYRWVIGLNMVLLLSILGSSAYGESAPVTTMGVVSTASAGSSVSVPVTVTGFNSIGKLTLTVHFNKARIRYNGATPHASLPGMSITYSEPSGNVGELLFSWTGSSNVSLSDGATLASLNFTYLSGTSYLEWWYFSGSVCQYQTYVGGTLVALDSSPGYLYFINGGVSDHTGPVTQAPVVTSASPGPVAVPITVSNFTNIGALTLYLDYDSSVLTFNSGTANTAISGALINSVPGSGISTIRIQWVGSNGVSLSDGATLITLNFTYLSAGASTSLTWFDNGPSCEYADASTDRLLDMPYGNFYFNGRVSGGSGGGLNLYLKNFLQGPFDPATHVMLTSLATANLIPLTQPYSGTPWSYSGAESITSYPSGIVDWVLVELRTGTTSGSVVKRRAALLKNDGTVLDVNGTSPLVFSALSPGNYYVVVYHRNHLPVMTAGTVSLPNTPSSTIDLTSSPSTNVYASTNGVILLESGVYGQIAGELVYDNVLKYSGPSNDKATIFSKIDALYTPPPAYLNSVILGYYAEDLNLDGVVRYSGSQNDPRLIFSNIDAFTDPTYLNSVFQGQVPVPYATP